MDDKTAALVVNVASMSTIVVGGFAGGAKMLGKAADLYEAGELGSTVMNGIRQIPKLPATVVRSAMDKASDVKTMAVGKMSNVLDKVSTKAGAAASKLDEIHVPSGVRVLDTGAGTMPVLTRVAASDTRLGGAVKQTFSSIESKTAGASEKMSGLASKGSQSITTSTKSLKSAGRVNSEEAEQANNYWKEEMGYENPPFTKGTTVKTVKLTESSDGEFVRTYGGVAEDGSSSGMQGPWVMLKKDIEGLTPEQIKEKYALPSVPKRYASVSFESGDVIRYGETAPNFGGNGGGIQFDITMNDGFIGDFKDAGEIPAGGIK
jgi:hypothetical protein